MTTVSVVIAIVLGLLVMLGLFWALLAVIIFIGAASVEDAYDEYPPHEDFQEKR